MASNSFERHFSFLFATPRRRRGGMCERSEQIPESEGLSDCRTGCAKDITLLITECPAVSLRNVSLSISGHYHDYVFLSGDHSGRNRLGLTCMAYVIHAGVEVHLVLCSGDRTFQSVVPQPELSDGF